MDVQAELTREQLALERILRVASSRPSLGFGDLLRYGEELDGWSERVEQSDNPGIAFTSSRRMVVFEYFAGTLRYYAGTSDPRSTREEGAELGDFASVRNALDFSEEYLVHQLAIQDIHTPRTVLWRQETEPRLGHPPANPAQHGSGQ